MDSSALPAAIYRAREPARPRDRVAVLTGAGISAESGIPTFRDALTGLWEKFRPEELATPEAFEANPKLVWDWYAWRRETVAKAEPNAGHQALAALERRCRAHEVDFTLVTQNVDGLHRAAGSLRVIELHGNIRPREVLRPASPRANRGPRSMAVPACPTMRLAPAPRRRLVRRGPAAGRARRRHRRRAHLRRVPLRGHLHGRRARGLAALHRAGVGAVVIEVNPTNDAATDAGDALPARRGGRDPAPARRNGPACAWIAQKDPRARPRTHAAPAAARPRPRHRRRGRRSLRHRHLLAGRRPVRLRDAVVGALHHAAHGRHPDRERADRARDGPRARRQHPRPFPGVDPVRRRGAPALRQHAQHRGGPGRDGQCAGAPDRGRARRSTSCSSRWCRSRCRSSCRSRATRRS